jgi:hypothetical protein
MSKTRTRARRSRTGAVELIIHPEQSAPVRVAGFCWRSRAELTALAAYLATYLWLDSHLPTWGVWVTLLAIPALLALLPPVRRFAHTRVMCVITRHRMRSCLRQVHASNRDGHLPWFLWTRPTGVGERVRLWMRPGVAARDIEHAADYLAAACYAREVRVAVSRKVAALVTVDVIRRDPLVSGTEIDSPLAGLPTTPGDFTVPVQPDPTPPVPTPRASAPVVVSTRDGVTDAPATAQPTKKAKQTKTSSTQESQQGSPVLVGGEDVTDYV